MKKKNINHLIILSLFVVGIGSCGVANIKTGGNGWDGLIPGLLGLGCLTAGTIYLIVYLISNIFIRAELKKEEVEYENDQTAIVRLRKRKLLRLLTISLVTYTFNLMLPYMFTGRQGKTSSLSILINVALLISSYFGILKGLKIAKLIWLVVIILLLIKSITFLAFSLLDSRYAVIYIFIPIAYLYIINIMSKSNLINNENFEDMV